MRTIAFVIAALFALGLTAGARAQEERSYDFTLPTGWEQTSFVDGAQIKRVEYIYGGDRSRALLKVKRHRVARGDTTATVIDREVQNLRFLPGYSATRSEPLGGGTYTGTMTQFDFTRGGRQLMGRYYFLAGDDSTVWELQFTGDRTLLGSLRNATDQIARSFKEK
jgi:hypothetical protein